MSSTRTVTWLLLLAAVLGGAARTSADDASPAQVAALLMRVLAYDQSLPDRARAHAVVTVLAVHKPGAGGSERTCRGVTTAVNSLGRRMSIAGKRVRAIDHAFSDPKSFVQAIDDANANAVFVCGGLGPRMAEVSRTVRRSRLLSVTDQADYMEQLSVGILNEAGTLGLSVNLAASRAEGAKLDPALLRIASVRR